ncbi:MAG: serine hydrolase [Pseudomonadota bacterium]
MNPVLSSACVTLAGCAVTTQRNLRTGLALCCTLLGAMALAGCASPPAVAEEPAQRRGAAGPELAWPTATPAQVGLDGSKLDALVDLIRDTPPADFRALAVARHGKLVMNEAFNAFTPSTLHDIRSAGKSVTAMLAGIAADQGLIDVSASIVDYFPERRLAPASPLRAIEVRHLLTMSSGLASDDYDDDSPGTELRMIATADYVDFALRLPMAFEPGERYAYSSAVAFLAGAIVENAAGERLEAFARRHLFNPLGIYELYWQASPSGRTTGMGNLFLTASDLAKLGQVMLDDGRWRGRRVLSSEWIQASLTSAHDISESDPFAHGYGYLWYLATIGGREVFFASGNGGNKLFVVPEEKLVVVTLSSAYGQGRGHVRSHNVFELVLAALD